ncbi:hypothetical protein [Chryseosolibacter indicus]|uniref:Uncharacterized protein n=1 Tax=Chryseosolibacter indicus TaxID=2782351 RepID=A0ABS5VSQ6_9BACT|nr:hypothetical protein [Chryseosolibacter indicus]MBT1703904.1 hypothetical protein [Chryseosolibacter indicus]
MKYRLLISGLLMIMGLTSAFAQQDSVHLQPPRRPDPNIPTSTQPSIPQTNEYNSTDPLIRIRFDAVPSSLRRNLEGTQYQGWEQSEIYHNKKTNEYSIDIRSGDSIKSYRFDRYGNPVNVNSPLIKDPEK